MSGLILGLLLGFCLGAFVVARFTYGHIRTLNQRLDRSLMFESDDGTDIDTGDLG